MSEKEKLSKWQEKEKKLSYERKSCWEGCTDGQKKKIFSLAEKYKTFLGQAKTERKVVEFIENFAKKNKMECFKNKEKAIAIVKTGKRPINEGLRIIVSHIDSPHLDLKRIPLHEEANLCFLKTHYYGGIKKYHWVNVPLSLIGIIIGKDGKKINVEIGEGKDDLCFVISDLLPHLAGKQMKKNAKDVVTGEQLTAIAGNICVNDSKIKEKIKLNVLDLLNKKYGICEKDMISAELQLVPSTIPRDVGFDKALIGGYGHDDKICAFASFEALANVSKPEYTTMMLFLDKEEIGSVGNTSAGSYFFSNVVMELCKKQNITDPMEIRNVFEKSRCISSDVDVGINPVFAEVHDMQNDPIIGGGVCIGKSTGWGGKYDANDSNAEYMANIVDIYDKNNILWQSAGMGKIDEGGGGTVSKYFSRYNMEVLDVGIAILGMHSPFEIASKIDLYYLEKAHQAFIK
ncbi:MAG: aminopeptidase [Candidatus Nanohalarchaeota archaeon]|nr:MAG: aminopeptidase [Candidatus Nanohaloarchaeota archaeon]